MPATPLSQDQQSVWQPIYSALLYPTFDDCLRLPCPVQRMCLPSRAAWTISHRKAESRLFVPTDKSPFNSESLVCYLCSTESSPFTLADDEKEVKRHICAQEHVKKLGPALKVDSAAFAGELFMCEECWRGFSRADSLHRHQKRSCPALPPVSTVASSNPGDGAQCSDSLISGLISFPNDIFFTPGSMLAPRLPPFVECPSFATSNDGSYPSGTFDYPSDLPAELRSVDADILETLMRPIPGYDGDATYCGQLRGVEFPSELGTLAYPSV